MKRKLIWLISIPLVFLLLLAAMNWGFVAFSFKETEVHLVSGKPGQLRAVGATLARENVIPSERLFRVLARLTKADTHLQSGIYRMDSRMGLWRVLSKLRHGEVERVAVLIKEGDDMYDIAEAAFKAGAVTNAQAFRDGAKAPELLKSLEKRFNPGAKLLDAEGFLYPDTYTVKKGEGMAELFSLAFGRFEQEIHKPHVAWVEAQKAKGRKVENLMFYLKAASLVEKETATLAERPLVASVIYNRLRINDLLRFDPSIHYAMKREGLWKLEVNPNVPAIRNEHFSIRSKWNTYWVHGLPYGPICCPSPTSFKAVQEPAKTEYLFFVAKSRSGKEHNFSKTYAEHQKFTQIYRSTP